MYTQEITAQFCISLGTEMQAAQKTSFVTPNFSQNPLERFVLGFYVP